MASDSKAGISAEADLRGLPDTHVGKVGLLVVGLDIGGVASDDRKERCVDGSLCADLELAGLADPAIGGRPDLAVG
jgi:hypothetical protein